MVLESERRECMAKKRPARPNPSKVGEPLVGPGAGISATTLAVFLVEIRIAKIARTRPVLFNPPFGPCIMGHTGLLVQKANLAMLERRSPRQKAEIRASSLCG
jgi:hypothetical protein